MRTVLALLALAALAMPGCLWPGPAHPPEGCILPEPGAVTAVATAFFREEPEAAVQALAQRFGFEVTGVQRGPEETGGGSWIQYWETSSFGYATLQWQPGLITDVRLQGGALRDLDPEAVAAAFPAGLPLTLVQSEESGWRATQPTPLGPMAVAFLWTPTPGGGVADATLLTAYAFEQAGWITEEAAEAHARRAGHCDAGKAPRSAEVVGLGVTDGRLAHDVKVVHGRCNTQVYRIDATTGATLGLGDHGWCG